MSDLAKGALSGAAGLAGKAVKKTAEVGIDVAGNAAKTGGKAVVNGTVAGTKMAVNGAVAGVKAATGAGAPKVDSV